MTAGAAIEFGTSGHTGPRKTWTRTPAQLAAEAELVGDVVVGHVDEVVSFAPPWHIFGRLFGEVLPRRRGIPVQLMHDDPCAAPVLQPGRRVLFVCLPASWLVLRRLTSQLRSLAGAVLLHGTGPTTQAAEETLVKTAGGPVFGAELFGSTETGGIGYRQLEAGHPAPWTLLPDVELAGDPDGERFGPGTQRLHVRSPRLGRPDGASEPPDSVLLQDVVQLLDRDHFVFLGRASRLIKVNGRRCSLDDIEQWAGEHLGTDVTCMPVRDEIRGEHYELFFAGRHGPAGSAEVWRQLRALPSTLPVPRKVHAVPSIPLTGTGKVKIDELFAYAERSAARGGKP